jgi:hypothetical protein
MESNEHLNCAACARRARRQVYPLYFTAAAWGLGAIVLALAGRHDPCLGDYAAQPWLVGLLCGALALQGTSLVIAIVRVARRLPASGRGLVGALAMTLLSLPMAIGIFFGIVGFMCWDF